VATQLAAAVLKWSCVVVAGGNVSLKCEACGKSFRAWASAGRRFCSKDCARPAMGVQHGESYTRLYTIWCDMKSRCSNPNQPAYAYYGARGIRVCKAWQNSFADFRDWANANGYEPHLQLDRKRVNGNYEPGNCRWATRAQQMQNTRKRRNAKTSKYKGVSLHSQNGRWVAQIHTAGVTTNLGCFTKERDAARAYDAEARKRFGKFANLNFPNDTKGLVSNFGS
jgi:hypothetical protein